MPAAPTTYGEWRGCGRRRRLRLSRRCRTHNLQLEPVAEARHRTDRRRAEHTPQTRDLCRQIVLVNHQFRPHPLEQCRLGHEPPRLLREHLQQIERACSELDRQPVAQQLPLGGFELEGAKLHDIGCSFRRQRVRHSRHA